MFKVPIILENSKIPERLSIFITIGAITLWPFIIFRGEASESVLNHEKIHIAQQQECFVVFFYFLYVFFWARNLIKFRKEKDLFYMAYMNIPFEIEAYENQDNLDYCKSRSTYSWFSYV